MTTKWKKATRGTNWPLGSTLDHVTAHTPPKGKQLDRLLFAFSDGTRVQVQGRMTVTFAENEKA